MQLTVIEQNPETTLLQILSDDSQKVSRTIVPTDTISIEDGVVTCAIDPYEGIPYGLPWEEILQVDLTVEELANNLRRYGLWTAEDIHGNPPALMSAIAVSYGMSASNLTGAVTKFTQE